MIEVRRSDQRGHANFGWLDSYHTFSFGNYYDAQQMGHSALRVINDDTVSPGAGFDTHGHRDMEIISLVTQGMIEHKDSMGNVQRLPAGEYQLMSAGKGVYHSEYNASKEEELKFLQIWIVPDEQGGTPGYQQKPFDLVQGLTPIITPDGTNGTLKIKQQASLSQLVLDVDTREQLHFDTERNGYLHVVSGSVVIDGQTLTAGDGAKLTLEGQVSVTQAGDQQAVVLVFDLP